MTDLENNAFEPDDPPMRRLSESYAHVCGSRDPADGCPRKAQDMLGHCFKWAARGVEGEQIEWPDRSYDDPKAW
jgi:hypothetical protein